MARRLSSSIKHLPGFSIGEVIVASFVMTVGIITTISLVSSSYKHSSESQKLIVASELAQEGVELVRNLRDKEIAKKVKNNTSDNVLQQLADISDLYKRTCRMDYIDNNIHCDAGGIGPMALHLDPGSKDFYQHGGSAQIQYYRRLKLSGDTTGIKVYSFVTWDSSTASDLNGTVGDALSACTVFNHCVYTTLFLTPWK